MWRRSGAFPFAFRPACRKIWPRAKGARLTGAETEIEAGTGRSRRVRPRHLVRAVLLLAALPVVFVLVAALALLGREITAPGWVREA